MVLSERPEVDRGLWRRNTELAFDVLAIDEAEHAHGFCDPFLPMLHEPIVTHAVFPKGCGGVRLSPTRPSPRPPLT